jgi:DNA-binding response OmpR family regulator
MTNSHDEPHARRALLVEDEPEALGILRDWIRGEGWDVRTAHSGEEALNIAKSYRPHLVIADYHLHGDATGVDLIADLRATGRKVRCILVTGALQNALLEGIARIHGVPILTKPFGFQRLRELISN